MAKKADLVQRLKDVGYYRLSAYMAPYREYNEEGVMTERFSPGTTLEKAWNLYLFDRQLRLLFMDAIERIEVFLRVKIAHIHTRENGVRVRERLLFSSMERLYAEIGRS